MKYILHKEIPKRYIVITKLLIKLGVPRRFRGIYQFHIETGDEPEKAFLYTIQHIFTIIHPEAQVLVKHNQAFYLLSDAYFMLSKSKRASLFKLLKYEKKYARSAILLYPVALEALINSVYDYCESPLAEKLSSIPLKKKWLDAPKNCLPYCGMLSEDEKKEIDGGKKIPSFDENKEPFKSYLELKDIRNDIVHLKSVINQMTANDLQGYNGISGCYPRSGIPKNIGAWRYKDAHKAYEIASRMIRESNTLLRGKVSDLLRGPRLYEYSLGFDFTSRKSTDVHF